MTIEELDVDGGEEEDENEKVEDEWYEEIGTDEEKEVVESFDTEFFID